MKVSIGRPASLGDGSGETHYSNWSCRPDLGSPQPHLSWTIRWPVARPDNEQGTATDETSATWSPEEPLANGQSLAALLNARIESLDPDVVAANGRSPASSSLAARDPLDLDASEPMRRQQDQPIAISRLVLTRLSRSMQRVRIGCRASQQLVTISPDSGASDKNNSDNSGQGLAHSRPAGQIFAVANYRQSASTSRRHKRLAGFQVGGSQGADWRRTTTQWPRQRANMIEELAAPDRKSNELGEGCGAVRRRHHRQVRDLGRAAGAENWTHVTEWLELALNRKYSSSCVIYNRCTPRGKRHARLVADRKRDGRPTRGAAK